jgi:hypothetical protein
MTPDKLKDFLTDPKVNEVIKESLERTMHGVYTIHRLVEMPELSHVDPEITNDMRQQAYHLFERASGLNMLLHLIIENHVDDYTRDLFAHTYISTNRKEDDLKALTRTVLATYAPKLKEQLES